MLQPNIWIKGVGGTTYTLVQNNPSHNIQIVGISTTEVVWKAEFYNLYVNVKLRSIKINKEPEIYMG